MVVAPRGGREQGEAIVQQQHPPQYAGRRVEEAHDVRARANEAWLAKKFKESEQRAEREREQAKWRLHEASKLVGSWRRRALAAEKRCVLLAVSYGMDPSTRTTYLIRSTKPLQLHCDTILRIT